MIKKFSCYDRAYQMGRLSWSGAAAAVAIEAGDWIGTAGLQFGTEDIRFTIHSSSVAKGCALSLSKDARDGLRQAQPAWQRAIIGFDERVHDRTRLGGIKCR